MIKPNSNYQILTSTGFEDFHGIKKTKNDNLIEFSFDDKSYLKCTFEHRLLTDKGFIEAKDIFIGQNVSGKIVNNIEHHIGSFDVFDVLEVDRHQSFITNGVVSHNCEFLGSSGTLIAGWKLKELVPKIPIFEEINIKQYIQVQTDHSYIAIADVSRGKGLDYSALQVIDISSMPYQQVLTYRSNTVVPSDFAEIINRIGNHFNNAFLLVEINDIGQQVAEILFHDYEYSNMLNTENKGRLGKRIMTAMGVTPQTDRGIRTTKPVKNIGCSMLKLLIEQNQLIVNDFDTIEEMSTFSKKGNSYEAEPGCHDDLIMSLVLFGWASDQPFFKELTDISTLLKIREMQSSQIKEYAGPLTYLNDGISEHMRPEKRGEDLWQPVNNVYPY